VYKKYYYGFGKHRGVYSSIIPPPWGGGKESKGLRAREEKFPWVIRENQCFHFPK
jgi:hypothetical protein